MAVNKNRNKTLHFLGRALKASPDEWRIRISQKAFLEINRALANRNRSFFSRTGHRRALGISDASVVEWWQKRDHRWFLNPERSSQIQKNYTDHEKLGSSIIQLANQVQADKFPLLGHGLLKIDAENRWHCDPILGIVTPKTFYGRIRFLDVQQVGDSKRVWEPSRFGWVYWLGIAYNLTGDARYAKKFRELTLDWFANNPYPHGIHFCSALELGFRAYAWVWALDLFRDIAARDSELLENLLHGIWISCRHIEHNLSSYFAPNTHLLGEAFALYAVGAAFPEFAEASRWRQLGDRILSEESSKQFHVDGTHRELSSCYHLYSTDFYLQATLIARQTGFAIDAAIEATAKRAAIRLAELVPDDLQLPQFNDCDGGRLTWFCQEPLDAAPTLLAAKSLWDAPAFPDQIEPGNGYHLWMSHHPMTESATKDQPAPNIAIKENPTCGALPDSGIVTHRNTAGDYLLFRSGSFGYMDCGHSHDAATSFILHFAGRPLLVDSGTGTYTQSRAERDRFRSAFGKNCLLINHQGPASPGDWFSWERTAPASLTNVEAFSGGFLCEGKHDSFSDALGIQVEISRRIVLYDQGVLVVIDQWTAEQPISCNLALTLHPSLTALSNENSVLLNDSDGNEYWLGIHHLASPVEITAGSSLLGQANVDLQAAGQNDSLDGGNLWPKFDTPVASSAPAKLTKVDFSPSYGVIGETNCVECDFGTSTAGCALTIVSRAGEISKTNEEVTAETRFTVGGPVPKRENSGADRYRTEKEFGNHHGWPVAMARYPCADRPCNGVS